ncbi:MAG: hypothetical protein Fur0024_4480 [Patescibacteria group bacterium]
MAVNNFKQQAVDLIKQSKNIIIFSSHPDGDSIASSIALYIVLKSLGKNVTAVADGYIPEIYKFLPNIDVLKNNLDSLSSDFVVTVDCTNMPVKSVRYTVENNKLNIFITPQKGRISKDLISFGSGTLEYDLIIAVDAPNEKQLGEVFIQNKNSFSGIPILNIDHHISNSNFGSVNLVDDKASSTCEILFGLIESLGEKLISEKVATALLTGILYDTRTFQNANTTSKSLTISAQLVSFGAKREEIVGSIYKTKSLALLKLWGKILSTLKIDKENKIVWGTVAQKDFIDFNVDPKNGTESIIDDILSGVANTETAILLTEKSAGFISGSVRCKGERDANEFAKFFGGGGHKKAAGFKIEGKQLPEVEKIVSEKAKIFFKNSLENSQNQNLDENQNLQNSQTKEVLQDLNHEDNHDGSPIQEIQTENQNFLTEEIQEVSESENLPENQNLELENTESSEEDVWQNSDFEEVQEVVETEDLKVSENSQKENSQNLNTSEVQNEKDSSSQNLETYESEVLENLQNENSQSSNEEENDSPLQEVQTDVLETENKVSENSQAEVAETESNKFDLDSLIAQTNITQNSAPEVLQNQEEKTETSSDDFNLDDILNSFPNPEELNSQNSTPTNPPKKDDTVDLNIDDLLK